ncbi:MAG: YraN family protein [Jatrophihabitans sp.]
MKAKDAIGKYGERVAARYLADSGMEILDVNWRCRSGELDLVALDGEIIVFCEVKTRSSTAYGYPAEAVGLAKAARLRRLAAQWLDERVGGFAEVRFDVISVLRQSSGAAQVDHIRGALA